MKKTLSIVITQYDNCNECSYCEFPDKNGKISIPDLRYGHRASIRLSGNNIARCGVRGKILKALNGCKIWFNGTYVINYKS